MQPFSFETQKLTANLQKEVICENIDTNGKFLPPLSLSPLSFASSFRFKSLSLRLIKPNLINFAHKGNGMSCPAFNMPNVISVISLNCGILGGFLFLGFPSSLTCPQESCQGRWTKYLHSSINIQLPFTQTCKKEGNITQEQYYSTK